MNLVRLMLLSAAFVAASAFAETVTWDGGSGGFAYVWAPAGWDGDENPGADDTARFVDIPRFKQMAEQGKMQSISVDNQDETIDAIRFENTYGININGGKNLYLNAITGIDLPVPGDDGVLTTNKVGPASARARGDTFSVSVGSNHVVQISGNFYGAEGDTLVKKTGVGQMLCTGQEMMNGADLWVAEGTVVRTGSGSPAFKGAIKVGGDGKPAELTNLIAGQSVLPAAEPLEILEGGVLHLCPNASPATYYFETVTVDRGVLDAGGNGFYTYNQSSTPDVGPTYTFRGATLTNCNMTVSSADHFKLIPDDRPFAFYGVLTYSGEFDKEIYDCPSRVDFYVQGDFNNKNLKFNKVGPGTMMVDCGDQTQTSGGTAGRKMDIKEGEFYFNSTGNGIGLGTNNVEVAPGATFGGSGNIVGVTNFYSYVWRGYQGNLNFTGKADARAVFAPGHPDFVTGEFVPGTFTVGDVDICTNNVTFASYGELRIAASANAVSKLVVNGKLTMSGNDVLAIEGPEDPAELPSGDHVIVSAIEPLNATFSAVTYNGEPLSRQCGKIVYGENSVVFHVPVRGLSIIIR